ncbi:MAG: acyl-CoA dehydrogenase [Inquilinus sp.]|nr:acyl-CoA dehydrogenase [Inquilinus sp.]
MVPYTAPIADMRFVLNRLVGLDSIAALPGYEEATPELVEAVLEEAGKLASGVLAPLNHIGDQTHSVLENGVVRTPEGFKQAYDQYRDGGWNAVPFDPEHGGQGLPWTVAFAVQEMWQAANMAFGLCPLLNQGAVELLQDHGTDEQKRVYLPKMIAGTWTGTMNLTEPQAGSDVGAVRTKAVRDGEVYRISGQKIYITYGEHDFADNIVHLVLARTPDAPSGIKGISLFVVPKFLVNEDGSLGERNDLRCVSLERKLGINASPTCVMAYGDNDGAVGFMVGEENRGIEYMFKMMNNARLSVGLQGIAIAERAYQQARDYARTRVQGRAVGDKSGGGATIIHHPDVRRMLLGMKAQIEAGRALIYRAAAALDTAKRHPDRAERQAAHSLVDLLTPVVKAWCTDVGCDVASTGVQIHGGMGFVEETGAAQHLRDARIAPIYEGTNGIQAADLVFRKVGRDGGAAASGFIAEIGALDAALAKAGGEDMAAIRARLADGAEALAAASGWVAEAAKADAAAAAAGSAHYLRMFGLVAGGYMMARAGLEAQADLEAGNGDAGFAQAKSTTARFFADQFLPQARGLLVPLTEGHRAVTALEEEAF